MLDTRRCIESLGATVTALADGTVQVDGGPERFHAPEQPLYCGNSGTSMRLLAGLVAGFPWTSVLTGDPSLSKRPMDRVAAPLRAMGATVEGQGARCLPPLAITGGGLHGVRWEPPVASSQVKSAVLLAGIQADGETVLHEPVRTRSHTEEMLAQAGADITVEQDEHGRTVTVRPSSLRPQTISVPADPSQAAFWAVAAAVVPASRVVLQDLYPGQERLGFLGVLRRMGARLTTAETPEGLEVTVTASPLQGTEVEASEIPSLDEVPVLAVAAACARGITEFHHMAELRVKESDRLQTVQDLVRALGRTSRDRGRRSGGEGSRRPAPRWRDRGQRR